MAADADGEGGEGGPAAPGGRIRVQVAFALPRRQRVVAVDVPLGCTAREAVRASGLGELFPEHPLLELPLGIFGQRVEPDFPLAPGDRVEIYRPLRADPRTVRRQLAAQGGTMGRPARRDAPAGGGAPGGGGPQGEGDG